MNRIGLPLALLIGAAGLVLLLVRSLGSGGESNRGQVASPVEIASPADPAAGPKEELVVAWSPAAPEGARAATRSPVARSGFGPSVYGSGEAAFAPSLIGKVIAGRGPVPGASVALRSAGGRLIAEAAT
ncbi:MAG: hypothetical protein O7B99_07395, partial [Planctomycetota bacterium]|nr:hypothetical protein [Planctomycetota bacterium]